MYVKRPRPTYTIAPTLCTGNGPGLHTQLPIIYVRETLSASALDLLKVDPQQLTAGGGGANAPARFGPPPPTASSAAPSTLPHGTQHPPPPRPAPPPQPPAPPPHGTPHHPAQHPLHNPQHPPPQHHTLHPPPRPAQPPRLVSRFPHRKNSGGQITKMEPGFSGSGAPERTAHPLAGLGAHIPTKMAPGHGGSPIRGILTTLCRSIPPRWTNNI